MKKLFSSKRDKEPTGVSPTSQQPGPPATVQSETPLKTARPRLQHIKAAVHAEAKRRNDVKNRTNTAQQTDPDPSSRLVFPMKVIECLQLEQIQAEVMRMFLTHGEGTFHSQNRSDGRDDQERDHAKGALDLLDRLTVAAATSSPPPEHITSYDCKKLWAALTMLDLCEEALEVAQLYTAISRIQSSKKGEPRYQAQVGVALLALTCSFFRLGKLNVAVASTTEALSVFTDLATRDSKQYNAYRAQALRIFSVVHTCMAKQDDSMHCLNQSIDICQTHRADHPAYQAGLALSMAMLAVDLNSVGQRTKALKTLFDSVDTSRPLLQTHTKAFGADIASSLVQFAILLAHAGPSREQDAHGIIQDSLQILQDLRQDRPDAYTSEWAYALANYSHIIGNMGQFANALAGIELSLKIYRASYVICPGLNQIRLATSLFTQSIHLKHAGRSKEALDSITESVQLIRALNQVRPTSFEPDLAMALKSYSGQLIAAGRIQDALPVMKETVALYRALHQIQPDFYAPDLAEELMRYSQYIRSEPQDKLDLIEESLKLYRAMPTQTRLPTYAADLAKTLLVYSVLLGAAGRYTDALVANEESVQIYRPLYQLRPTIYTRDLKSALVEQYHVFLKLKRNEDARAAIAASRSL
ncbi:hypothetical protein OC846_001786 [Tilletia horrida]|uniref:Uncharacterized protein n=1 Tax=Tilletia horrida TaxID=155126 RepID=A0AAN6GS66_9BASI|nr:hypothetical protein OC845_001852 [Tilletia horrida]KAK0555273.1 hypothetical protein OC846_001786 [Tilletia horrida]